MTFPLSNTERNKLQEQLRVIKDRWYVAKEKGSDLAETELRQQFEDLYARAYVDSVMKQQRHIINVGGEKLYIPKDISNKHLQGLYQSISKRAEWGTNLSDIKGEHKGVVASIRKTFNNIRDEIATRGKTGKEYAEASNDYAKRMPEVKAVEKAMKANVKNEPKIISISQAFSDDYEPTTMLEKGIHYIQNMEVNKLVDDVNLPKSARKGKKPLDVDQNVKEIDANLAIGQKGVPPTSPVGQESARGETGFAVQTFQQLNPTLSPLGAVVPRIFKNVPSYVLKKQRGYSDFMHDPFFKKPKNYVTERLGQISPNKLITGGRKGIVTKEHGESSED